MVKTANPGLPAVLEVPIDFVTVVWVWNVHVRDTVEKEAITYFIMDSGTAISSTNWLSSPRTACLFCSLMFMAMTAVAMSVSPHSSSQGPTGSHSTFVPYAARKHTHCYYLVAAKDNFCYLAYLSFLIGDKRCSYLRFPWRKQMRVAWLMQLKGKSTAWSCSARKVNWTRKPKCLVVPMHNTFWKGKKSDVSQITMLIKLFCTKHIKGARSWAKAIKNISDRT